MLTMLAARKRTCFGQIRTEFTPIALNARLKFIGDLCLANGELVRVPTGFMCVTGLLGQADVEAADICCVSRQSRMSHRACIETVTSRSNP